MIYTNGFYTQVHVCVTSEHKFYHLIKLLSSLSFIFPLKYKIRESRKEKDNVMEGWS